MMASAIVVKNIFLNFIYDHNMVIAT